MKILKIGGYQHMELLFWDTLLILLVYIFFNVLNLLIV